MHHCYFLLLFQYAPMSVRILLLWLRLKFIDIHCICVCVCACSHFRLFLFFFIIIHESTIYKSWFIICTLCISICAYVIFCSFTLDHQWIVYEPCAQTRNMLCKNMIRKRVISSGLFCTIQFVVVFFCWSSDISNWGHEIWSRFKWLKFFSWVDWFIIISIVIIIFDFFSRYLLIWTIINSFSMISI